MIRKEDIAQIITSPKLGAGVAAATTSTGIGSVFDIIPDDIGKLASLFGIVLTILLMYLHTKRGRIELKKLKLEVAILEQRKEERKKTSLLRREAGLPTRRRDDS